MSNINDGVLHFTNPDGDEKAILGTLEGYCADAIDPTRNGRKYTDELWQNVFKDPIVNELLEQGGILGELDHPAPCNSEGQEGREETDTARVAIMMKEKPIKKMVNYGLNFIY